MANMERDDGKITIDKHRKWNRLILIIAATCLAFGFLGAKIEGCYNSRASETEATKTATTEKRIVPDCTPTLIPKGYSSVIDLVKMRCIIAELSNGGNAPPIRIKIESGYEYGGAGTDALVYRWNYTGKPIALPPYKKLAIDRAGILELWGEGTVELRVVY